MDLAGVVEIANGAITAMIALLAPALLVILVLASLVFAYVQRSAFGIPVATEDLCRRRNLWFGITFLAFLAHNFSIYIVGAAVLLLVTIKAEKNPLALFLFLVFAVPPI
jgi:hypothetical protein